MSACSSSFEACVSALAMRRAIADCKGLRKDCAPLEEQRAVGVSVEVALRRSLQRPPLAVGDVSEVAFRSVEEKSPEGEWQKLGHEVIVELSQSSQEMVAVFALAIRLLLLRHMGLNLVRVDVRRRKGARRLPRPCHGRLRRSCGLRGGQMPARVLT